ncbi:MAG TPA: hypothetical protein PKC28_09550 [Bdellovibrionales bacterium]|nr:hypothetical protein [Bdellovibrionales bacterium]
MSKLLIFVSATIVLIFSSATGWPSPQDTVPVSTDSAREPVTGEPIDENMSVSPPPDTPVSTPSAKARYYPYRQALTFRAGQASELEDVDFDDYVLGFQYLFPKFLSPKLEAGADLQKDGVGHLHAGVRYYKWERSYFRPSVKVALDHMAEAEENLATLVEFDNYFLRLSATLEYVVWNPFSLRLEPEILMNHKDRYLVVTVGLSRGW